MPLICEGIVTTRNDDGSTNISPMGPIVDREMTELTLRPFNTSRTYRNLVRSGQGVFHITDDVELLARAATNQIEPFPTLEAADCVDGEILTGACRWYAFQVTRIAEVGERRDVHCKIVAHERRRDFFGLNRAMFAVVEAAILATRLHILESDLIRSEMQRLRILVTKTGGEREISAFDFLQSFVDNHVRSSDLLS